MYLLSSKLKSEQTPSQSPGKTPSMSLFWLLAGCYGVQQFAWQILTCLQTFAYCSPSSGRIVKSVVQTEKCTGLHCIKEQLLLCKQIFFSFSLIHTVLKYNGCCLQSSWHLSCKLQRTMRIWKFPKVFFFFFWCSALFTQFYPSLPSIIQQLLANQSANTLYSLMTRGCQGVSSQSLGFCDQGLPLANTLIGYSSLIN